MICYLFNLLIQRNEQQGSLVVDNGAKLSRRAPGTLKQLNTNTGLYIGKRNNLLYVTFIKLA